MNGLPGTLGIIFSILFGDSYSVPFAYLDPGTGAMIISAIVGILATLLLALRTYWYKLIALFKSKTKRTDKENTGKEKGKEES